MSCSVTSVSGSKRYQCQKEKNRIRKDKKDHIVKIVAGYVEEDDVKGSETLIRIKESLVLNGP